MMKINLVRNYRNWRRIRRTFNELDSLTNRELADLGIQRSEIKRMIRQTV